MLSNYKRTCTRC